MIVGITQAFDNTTGVPQTHLNLIGSDSAQSTALGPFTSVSGAELPGPPPGGVFLDVLAAQDLNALDRGFNHPVRSSPSSDHSIGRGSGQRAGWVPYGWRQRW